VKTTMVARAITLVITGVMVVTTNNSHDSQSTSDDSIDEGH